MIPTLKQLANVPAVATVPVPRELMEQLSIVCFLAVPHYCPDLPPAGKAKLEALATQCFSILNPAKP